MMLCYCANLKAIRYESTGLNRIVADKSHSVIVAKHVICEINDECIIDEWAWPLFSNDLTVSRKNGFVNYDFQQLTLILGFCAPKNGSNGLISKNYCLIE